MDGAFAATAWLPGKLPRALEGNSKPRREEVVWIECREEADPHEVLALLEKWHRGPANLETIIDVLLSDPKPETCHREVLPGVRNVSAFAARTAGPAPGGSLLPVVELRQLECLAGDNWLVSCWHTPDAYHGSRSVPRTHIEERPGEGFTHGLPEDWVACGARNAADLGLLLLRTVARTFPPLRKELFHTLNHWQSALAEGDTQDRRTLADMLGLLAIYYQRLSAFNPPKSVSHSDSWFRDGTIEDVAEEIDQLIDSALAHVSVLGDKLRSSFALLTSMDSADQSKRTQSLERRLSLVTGLLLVPTLVVGLFGANTQLPGRDRWTGFVVMVLLMILGGGLSYGILERSRRSSGAD